LIINGPATSDYDEDLGVLFISDWSHQTLFQLWNYAQKVGAPTLDNGLINGTNTYDCSNSTDASCIGGGKKFETVFVPGTKYRLRLINVATNGHLQFSIDGHNLTVIANDLVPIVPYQTESLLLGIGQRYDVIVEANAEPGDYWLRGGWQESCTVPNHNAANITGIVRYDSTSTADPTTTGITVSDTCGDEPLASLVPHLALDVGNYSSITEENVGIAFGDAVTWTINSSTLYLNWSDPTNHRIATNQSIFPTDYNVVPVNVCCLSSRV
jgi:FtsP/CotA-like multicopper oxidase with cupredoxin domain